MLVHCWGIVTASLRDWWAKMRGIWKIAVLRALNLGDLMVAIPAFRSLRAAFPEAEISLIGLPWARSFTQRFDHYIDRFVEFPGYPGLSERPTQPEQLERFLAEQRAYGYDLAIQMHGSGRSSTPCILALGAHESAGYYVGDRPFDLTIGAPYPTDRPEIERNLSLMRLIGCPDLGTDLEFPLTLDDRHEADCLLAGVGSGRPLIGIHPGASSPERCWPVEQFAAVADRLVGDSGATIIITGGPGDFESASRLAATMSEPATVLAGKTSLGGLGAIIARLDLFLSNDTGPAHIAVATGTPSIRIFGPADPRRWAPLDSDRHPFVRASSSGRPDASLRCEVTQLAARLLPTRQELEVSS